MRMSDKHSIVSSADGTTIAFEKKGSGPPLILIGGSFNDRQSPAAGLPLANLLADTFTCYAYDRRGRGHSDVGGSYTVERELEDLAALIAHAGAPVRLFGHSSGGVLGLLAAANGLEVTKVALYEPPYSMDADADRRSAETAIEVRNLVQQGRNGDAAAAFLSFIGMPSQAVEGMRRAPFWKGMERIAPTLIHDNAVMRYYGSSLPPKEVIAKLRVPVLVVAGNNSPQWLQAASRAVADAATSGSFKLLENVDHAAPPSAYAGVLRTFFAAH
jgi:pimeloyl-ACP methyl ester carboxylesterase